MRFIIFFLSALFVLSVNASSMDKTVNYVVMPNGDMYCLLGNGSRMQRCTVGLRMDILNNGGVYKADGVFRSITYNPYKKPEKSNCGLKYDPKTGKTLNIKCN